jgi:hypothetical protein
MAGRGEKGQRFFFALYAPAEELCGGLRGVFLRKTLSLVGRGSLRIFCPVASPLAPKSRRVKESIGQFGQEV